MILFKSSRHVISNIRVSTTIKTPARHINIFTKRSTSFIESSKDNIWCICTRNIKQCIILAYISSFHPSPRLSFRSSESNLKIFNERNLKTCGLHCLHELKEGFLFFFYLYLWNARFKKVVIRKGKKLIQSQIISVVSCYWCCF